MSQQSSLTQSAHSVRLVLTAYNQLDLRDSAGLLLAERLICVYHVPLRSFLTQILTGPRSRVEIGGPAFVIVVMDNLPAHKFPA